MLPLMRYARPSMKNMRSLSVGSRSRAVCQTLGILSPLLASTVPTLFFGLLFGSAVAYVLKNETPTKRKEN